MSVQTLENKNEKKKESSSNQIQKLMLLRDLSIMDQCTDVAHRREKWFCLFVFVLFFLLN